MSKYAAIAIAYNRVNSLKRLLESLENAFYDEDCDLIISIDKSDTQIVEKTAIEFEWTHGRKIVKTYLEHMGLRKHVLLCGDYVYDYDAIAVLEDDIIVSKSYFIYMKETVFQYHGDEQIAGISLYSHLWNVVAEEPFEPAYSKYDVYMLQFAQSWGQIWMKDQWIDFKKWYLNNYKYTEWGENIPQRVANWPQSSWLKYHIKYCIENDKYFIYPYVSLSTCYTDVGEHNTSHTCLFQVPIRIDVKLNYSLPQAKSMDLIKYDAFFERVFSSGRLLSGVELQNVCVNLYGKKRTVGNNEYIATMDKLPYQLVDSYALEVRPHEENITHEIYGKDIFLYRIPQKTKLKYREISKSEFKYRHRIYYERKMLIVFLLETMKEYFAK